MSKDWKFALPFFPILGTFAFAVGLGAAATTPSPDPLFNRDLDEVLDALSMSETDLTFSKDVIEPRALLAWNRSVLQQPLLLPARGEEIARSLADPRPYDSAWLARLWECPTEVAPIPSAEPDTGAITAEWRNSLSPFLAAAARAAQQIERAWPDASHDERAYLLAALLDEQIDSSPPQRFACFADAGFATNLLQRIARENAELDRRPVERARADRLKMIRREELIAAGTALIEAALQLNQTLDSVHDFPDHVLRYETSLGTVQIGTRNAERYTEPALLIVDPGGDDQYEGSAAQANGLRGHPLSVVIDREGDDSYRGQGLIGAGGSLMGVSVLIDRAGDDRYRARYIGQGAAIGGVALLLDEAGDDVYEAGMIAQGAGVLGIGILRDRTGRDGYRVDSHGQGFSSALGIGLLSDLAGSDRYAGGAGSPDTDRHNDRFLSLCQGFSIGLRPFRGGGIAALYDAAGNDTYIADVYGQGVGYWYASGFLIDGGGHDHYRTYQYGQGAGIHLAAGLLVDRDGDDAYIGGTLVQAAAHDYGVGMLLDQGGRDAYQAETSSQGRAMNNGCALLHDAGGDDRYYARETTSCQGIGNEGGHRDYGALGLLIDRSGDDAYSCGAPNGRITERPLYGAIHDREDTP